MSDFVGRSLKSGLGDLACRCERWVCTPKLDPGTFASVRRRLMLDGFKWDPQIGDVETLAPFALVLPTDTWLQLSGLAERLAAEALQAEAELSHRPDLLARLGLPRVLGRVLMQTTVTPTPAAARVVRFDFHPTADGWRISEANSDVPGGYTESSNYTQLMAERFPGLQPAGRDPALLLAHALALFGKHVALLAATGYLEDQQIVAYLAALLRQLGCVAHLAHPRQISWNAGVAQLNSASYCGPLDAIFRFYQGEWLPLLPHSTDWPAYLRGGQTPVCNPGTALLTESKRFPLVWKRLSVSLPTWQALLPETQDVRAIEWQRDPDWILKTAFCNNGDTVTMRSLTGFWRWCAVRCQARLCPGQWVAQRRFEVLPLSTPIGLMYPCLGVYTVNGMAAGIYGRLAPRPLIDFAAVDVAVLIRPDQASVENR